MFWLLLENTLFGTVDKVKIAIERLQEHEPQEGYYVCFSGGKDSTVMYDLVKKSGVKYDVHYNITTIEPPDLLDFVRKNYPEVEMIPPKNNMYDLVIKHGYPPTRRARYCTSELKSVNGGGGGLKLLVLGQKNLNEELIGVLLKLIKMALRF